MLRRLVLPFAIALPFVGACAAATPEAPPMQCSDRSALDQVTSDNALKLKSYVDEQVDRSVGDTFRQYGAEPLPIIYAYRAKDSTAFDARFNLDQILTQGAAILDTITQEMRVQTRKKIGEVAFTYGSTVTLATAKEPPSAECQVVADLMVRGKKQGSVMAGYTLRTTDDKKLLVTVHPIEIPSQP